MSHGVERLTRSASRCASSEDEFGTRGARAFGSLRALPAHSLERGTGWGPRAAGLRAAGVSRPVWASWPTLGTCAWTSSRLVRPRSRAPWIGRWRRRCARSWRALGDKLVALTPALADCINRHRSALKAPEFCFAAAEPGRISLAFHSRSGWQAVRSRRIDGPLPETLPTLLKQEAVVGGAMGGGMLYVCADAMPDMAPFAVPGWRMAFFARWRLRQHSPHLIRNSSRLEVEPGLDHDRACSTARFSATDRSPLAPRPMAVWSSVR